MPLPVVVSAPLPPVSAASLMASAPCADAVQVDTVMTDGAFLRRFSSSMSVKPVGENECRMEMRMLMQPNIAVPFGIKVGRLGWAVRARVWRMWGYAIHTAHLPAFRCPLTASSRPPCTRCWCSAVDRGCSSAAPAVWRAHQPARQRGGARMGRAAHAAEQAACGRGAAATAVAAVLARASGADADAWRVVVRHVVHRRVWVASNAMCAGGCCSVAHALQLASLSMHC